MNKVRLKGVFPPMITPFLPDGEVDFSGFEANLKHWGTDRLAGFLVNGSNSETAYLTDEEKIKLVELTVKHANGRTIMAGTGMESLKETIRFTNLCADLGADCALVLTPSYYDASMTSAVLIDFFTKLADASRIPILIYNVPKFTHVNIKADAVAALAKHPNIIGMKDSTGDIPQMASFINVTRGQEFTILVGTASAWYPALCLGVEGAVLALANCNPNECAMVQEAFEAGDWKKAREIYLTMFPLNTAVTGTYGIPGLKAACDYNGYIGGCVRSPLLQCSADSRTAVESIVKTATEKMKTV